MKESFGKLKLLSLNVRGLRERVKRKSVFAYLKDQKCEVYYLQETYCQKQDEKIWSSEWGGRIFFTHGTTHSKGACILLKPDLDILLGNEYSDSEGRVVLINVSINKQWFSLCNIYAPTDNVKQNAFLNNLVTLIMSKVYIKSLIIGGDWNATLNKIDKQGLRKWAPSSYRDNIISAMNELDMIDIMRDLHPKKKMFTYESKQYKSKSRLDFFLISNKLKQCVSKTSIRIPVRSDHKAVGL